MQKILRNITQHKTSLDKTFYYLLLTNIALYLYASIINFDLQISQIFSIFFKTLTFNVGFLMLIWIALHCIPNKKITRILTKLLIIFYTIIILI
ncbi:hypothetical protein CQA66_08620 [Helicobacter aurati]|uniref:Uncharacterized protein n=1 Tax=Helicobacter aurati TaxID=137778 RepID=A0A3D8J074_9HELI|nr:hypothetical protein [Helicobacter aurati]RDU70254.1 hypothetical protein CQA66_08620 [Helicobacter aurati]